MNKVKRRVRTGIVIVSCIVIFILLWKYAVSYSFADKALVIKNDPISGFSYKLYGNHAELTEYKGQETEVNIPATLWFKPVTVIGEECFYFNEVAEKVILTENVVEIKKDAFAVVENLTEVIGGENVRILGKSAFQTSEKLNKLELGNKLEIIVDNAFYNCRSLQDLGEQRNLREIGEYAFYNSGLQVLEINEDTVIGRNALAETEWSKKYPKEFVIFEDGNLIQYNGTDTEVYVPDGVKIINGAFIGKPEISAVYLPNTVTAIYEFSFADDGEIDVYIPTSVTEIGNETRGTGMVEDVEITIYTTEGSYAQEYAKTHGIKCEIVEPW